MNISKTISQLVYADLSAPGYTSLSAKGKTFDAGQAARALVLKTLTSTARAGATTGLFGVGAGIGVATGVAVADSNQDASYELKKAVGVAYLEPAAAGPASLTATKNTRSRADFYRP